MKARLIPILIIVLFLSVSANIIQYLWGAKTVNEDHLVQFPHGAILNSDDSPVIRYEKFYRDNKQFFEEHVKNDSIHEILGVPILNSNNDLLICAYIDYMSYYKAEMDSLEARYFIDR